MKICFEQTNTKSDGQLILPHSLSSGILCLTGKLEDSSDKLLEHSNEPNSLADNNVQCSILRKNSDPCIWHCYLPVF